MKLSPIFAHVTRLQRVSEKMQKPEASARQAGPATLMEWVPWASPEFAEPRHLESLCVELQRVLRGERVEVCVSVPPRHGKSTTVHHLIAMLLVQDPTKRVLYASYDLDFAAYNLRKIRGICLRVGLAIGKIDRKEEFELIEGGGVMACGIQAPPTGRGFALVVVDDPIRRLADALSRAIRDRIGEGFGSDLYSRQDPGMATSFVIVATRWHEDDLTGRQAAKGWRVINLPAINGRGEALAPSLFPLEELERFRRQSEYTWSSLYMGDPSPRTGRMFGDVHLVESVPREGITTFGVDLAHTAKRRSDRHGVLEMRGLNRKFYVADFCAKRGPLTDHYSASGELVERGFVHEISERMAARPGARAAMYTGKDEDLVLDMLGKLDGPRVHVEARRAVHDKRERATPAATAWNAGDIYVLNADWTDDFCAHLLSFTGADGGEDEEADCIATAFDLQVDGGGVGVAPPKTSSRGQRLGLGRKMWT